MANVSPYYRSAEAGYVVDRLPFREEAIWNHRGFLIAEDGL